MSSLAAVSALPSAPVEFQARIGAITERMKLFEHTFRVEMEHLLHAGMYARTARVAADQAFTSVLIKIPTVLIVSGHCAVHPGDRWRELKGYNVLPASAGRTQAYVTFAATELTMIFPSSAKTVEEAEREFSDDAGSLFSRRRGEGAVTITERQP